MIFTVRDLGFEIGPFLLEGWWALAARAVCAAVIVFAGLLVGWLLRRKIFPALQARSWHFAATPILLRSLQNPLARMAFYSGLYLALTSLPWAIPGLTKFLFTAYKIATTFLFCQGLYNASEVADLLLASRDLLGGVEWVKRQVEEGVDVSSVVEKGKAAFVGPELIGKSLGVIGLGAVGGPLANAARNLGMTVYGCDPFISIEAAWHLDSHIVRVNSRDEIYSKCDIISLHTPLLDDTRGMINAEALAKMKDGVIVLNFARDLLVDDDAMAAALASGKVARYVTDFPNGKTANMPGCIAIPHLGASTEESEDNCAKMAVQELMDYLENGNIKNSVNYPNCDMGVCRAEGRITLLHRNIPNSLGRFTAAIAGENINIDGLVNKSRGEYAYTMLDLDRHPSADAVEHLKQIDGVLKVRVIK